MKYPVMISDDYGRQIIIDLDKCFCIYSNPNEPNLLRFNMDDGHEITAKYTDCSTAIERIITVLREQREGDN